MAQPKKEKKTDYEALESPFMRIPQMKVDLARCLIDLGYRQIYDLAGRAPDSLRDEVLNRPSAKQIPDLYPRLKLAVYFAETDDPDPAKLKLTHWLE